MSDVVVAFPHTGPVTGRLAKLLFQIGLSTHDIAGRYRVQERDVFELLTRQREADRNLGNSFERYDRAVIAGRRPYTGKREALGLLPPSRLAKA